MTPSADRPEPARSATATRLERATGDLTTAAIARMEAELPWYRAMSAEHRSWISLVAQAGIRSFVEWFKHPAPGRTVTGEIFGTAPRELARAITLRQTVELVRITIDVVEHASRDLAAPGEEDMLRESVLLYAREVAFAAAQVYAQAAEARGAWDARLEALVIGALLRGEPDDALRSRAAALGWGHPASVTVVIGEAPAAEAEVVIDGLRRAARFADLDILTGVQGDRLVAVVGGTTDGLAVARTLAGHFGPGPVVVGPTVPDLLAATRSAAEAQSGLIAAAAWPGVPRPVEASDLLPERALAGDALARARLLEEVYRPLLAAGNALLETVSAYLEHAGSLEATARALFVHANTVRYRLRRAADVSGLAATDPRGALALQVALIIGRLDGDRHTPAL